MLTEHEYAFWLVSCSHAGFATAEKLIGRFGSLEEAYKASEKDIMNSGIYSRKAAEELITSRDDERIRNDFENLSKKGMRFTFYGDRNYPEKLTQIKDPPFGLFYKGSLPDPCAPAVAVVGARKCSYEGTETARKMSCLMAGNGIQVISGMARGIDAAAHSGALEKDKGKTFAVLGCGADICYPAQNIEIYTQIQKNGGIISEFVPGTAPFASNFPRRNRIISGLSDGVLVVQAGLKSGSIITADTAASQGKDVYAVPGSIYDEMYKGTNRLIQDGACLVTGISDILDALGIYKDNDVTEKRDDIISSLKGTDRMVYSVLGLEPVHINRITGETGLELSQVYDSVERLSGRGLIRYMGCNYYAVVL